MEAKFCNAILATGSGLLHNAAFSIADGCFANIAAGSDEGYDLGGRIVIPGFIDSHIHGLKGCDFEDPDCDFEGAAQLLKKTGTTSFLATISPFTPSGIRKAPYKTLDCAGLEGFHLEGPYLNPGKKGGFYDGQIRPYDSGEAEEIFREFNGRIRIVTAAPECVNIPSLCSLARKYGFHLSAGHTEAAYDTALEAFRSGFTRTTHLFNAMRAFDHRAPAILDAALLKDKVQCEIIADLHHLSLQALKLILRLKPIGMLAAITDCVCPDVPGITVRGHLAYKGETVYGSQSTMYDLFLHLTRQLQLPLADTVRLTSVNAGKALNLNVGDIAPGMQANFIVMDENYCIETVYTSSDFT